MCRGTEPPPYPNASSCVLDVLSAPPSFQRGLIGECRLRGTIADIPPADLTTTPCRPMFLRRDHLSLREEGLQTGWHEDDMAHEGEHRVHPPSNVPAGASMPEGDTGHLCVGVCHFLRPRRRATTRTWPSAPSSPGTPVTYQKRPPHHPDPGPLMCPSSPTATIQPGGLLLLGPDRGDGVGGPRGDSDG